jgi:hypothetical protein
MDFVRPTEMRQVGPWELQMNPLRSLRPCRMAAALAPGIRRPFDSGGFHFNKPFLQKEILWSGERSGRSLSLFYNKFPFVSRHGLLVVDPMACRPQFLENKDHLFVWQLLEVLARSLPGLGLGFNGYGAYASVNHLHFQTFVRERPLPIAEARWGHNGGADAYPLDSQRFDDPTEAWAFIDELHKRQLSYNLIYLPGRVYCVPRARQGTYRGAPWSSGFAWHEVAGGFATFDRDDFERLDEAEIRAQLEALRVPAPA